MSLIKFEIVDFIGTLTITRPEALNALNTEVLKEIDSVLTKIDQEKTLRCLIITGSGEKAFVAGADIKEMNGINSKEAQIFAERGQAVFSKIESLYCPVIAAVNGFALGGGLELALACDFIIASKNAKLGLPECTLGLIPGFGGTVRLARRVGPALAKQWTYTGAMISAEEALRTNLVNSVHELINVVTEAEELAKTMSSRSPQSLMLIKKSINSTYGKPVSEAMTIEAHYFAEVFGTFDQKEGVTAFIEKRKPAFKSIGEQR
ncbi:MAG: enoyl-CoA hydratase/isomerase family protein [Bdellovibrionaceae bacterium]|nr:enoyl-CoA hydratase/isomerase family protein [Pseudobdellovibrionaceae bacterium]